MSARPIHVLFLCTGNSARSILAEGLMNDLGRAQGVIGWSAGSHPAGVPHPDAIAELTRRGHRADLYRSKSWDEFAGPDAPAIDLVITVCDAAAGESCPVFPGAPVRVHWPAPDPAHIPDDAQRRQAFADVYNLMHRRITELLALPREALKDRDAVQALA